MQIKHCFVGNLCTLNVSAESRLQALFPDVNSWDLVSAIRHSTSEQAAIDRLLAQGYVMSEH